MTSTTLTLNELEDYSVLDLFKRVLAEQLQLTIQLPDGQEVTIQPKPDLKPLLVFDGYIPNGWKDAIYE